MYVLKRNLADAFFKNYFTERVNLASLKEGWHMIYIPEVVYQVKTIVKKILQNNILGIYLYGSAILGGLHVNSDIDILIISNRELTGEERRKLTGELMKISGKVGDKMRRPLEVTIINRRDIVPWKFPPKCEYMYGEWLREQIENGAILQPECDPDIAILLWQAGKHSVVIGEKNASEMQDKKVYPCASELIPQIPELDIERAIRISLPNLLSGLKGDERNVLLTLARMWLTLVTGEIRSKDEAAEWAFERLPKTVSGPLDLARRAYLGECEDKWEGMEKEVEVLAMILREKINEAVFNVG